MSFNYQCSVGNYLREEVQEHRETIYEMQLEIDRLVRQRDQAMDQVRFYEKFFNDILQGLGLNKNETN